MSGGPEEESVGLPTAVGFIGLGAMGKPMVLNLAKGLPPSSRIFVHDVVPAAVDEVHAARPDVVVKCRDARDVTERSDVVLTMLPEGAHVRSVYLDPATGIAAGLPEATTASPTRPSSAKLLIDSSTIDTATNLHIRARLASLSPDTAFYDAPVSGGVLGAASATIAFYLGCGAADPALPRLRALLGPMGAQVIPCGAPSLGLAAKLANNYLSGVITIATSEAMDMGMRAGLRPDVLARVFRAGTAQNAICDTFNPVPGVCPRAPASNGYRGGFRVQLMRKDIGLAVDMARRGGARNVLGASALGVFAAASDAPECRDLDSRVVYRYLGGREDWRSDAED